MTAGDLLELAPGHSGGFDVVLRQRDLHVRGQQRGPLQRLRGLADRPADRGRRGPDVALRQPQQRQAGLGLAPQAAGLAIGRLGRVELAPQAQHLALLVGGLAHGALVHHAARQALPEPAQLAERLLPGASERHELGTVHVADARVGDHVGLLLAPARQRGRPLARAAQLVRVLAEADRVAVDEARGDRRELPRRHGHHRLVHQPPALVDAPQAQHRAALVHPRERDEVAVAAALADRGRLAGGGVRGLVVAGRHLLDADRGEHDSRARRSRRPRGPPAAARGQTSPSRGPSPRAGTG